MKPKSLIPLVVILAVLAGLVVWKKSSVQEVSIQEQVGLVTLLPDGISKSDITKLELFSGAAQDQKLTLAYNKDDDKWLLASHFNSAVKKDAIDDYLDSLVKIKGEPRATAATDSDLDLYNLSDAKAFHVQGYKEGSEEPYFHLLVGKSPGYNSVFIRKAGSNDVFVEETNLRQQAGIQSDIPQPVPGQLQANAAAPQPGMWLDKLVVKLDPEKINKVAVTMPDKSLVFERHEVPKPEPVAAEGAEEAAPPVPAEPEKPMYEWKVASGGPGAPVKESGPKMMAQKLSYLEGTDVVDPSKKSEYGLESPVYVSVVSTEGGEDVRLEGGRPDPNGDGYLTVAGSANAPVYKVSKFIFEQVFPKGGDVFDLPALTIDKETIEKIEVAQPEGSVTVVKDGEGFRVASPVAALEPQRTAAETLAQTFTNWKPADYADNAGDLGAPTKTVTVTGGGQTHTIKLYGPAKHVAGTYATVDDGPNVLVMSNMDAAKVFVNPRDLYVRTLLDIDDLEIAEIRVAAAAGSYALLKNDDETWTFSADGTTLPADNAAAEGLAGEVSVLQAEDILFGRTSIEGATDSVVVKMKDGTEHVVTVGPEKDGQSEVKISGKEQVFLIAADSRSSLFPAAETVKRPEPPAPEPAPEAPAPTEAPVAPEAPAAEAPAPTEAPVAPEAPTAEAPAAAETVTAVEAVVVPPAAEAVEVAEPAPAPAP